MTKALQKALTRRFDTLDSAHPLYTVRQQAMSDFEKQGLPTAQEESYKYTPFASLLPAYFDSVRPNTPVQTKSEKASSVTYHDIDAHPIVLLDGKISKVHAPLADKKHAVQVLTFQEAYQQQHRAFLAHFSKHAQSKADAFVALNTALFDEGVFVHIADNAVIDKPLLLYHCMSAHEYPPSVTYPRLLVVAGKHSQASIISSWQTEGFTNAVAEIVLQDNARLDYCTLQTNLGEQAYQVNTTQCYQAQHSTLNTYTFTWSGALVKNNLSSVIDAAYGETNMYGLYCLRKQQHVDNCTRVDHRKPYTYSNELYKGIMMDESTGVFNGKIYVRAEAQKTHAFQRNDNLVLSNNATLHTKPQLEIWADDVKCSHGATTGQIDREQLFYLQTRGLPENAAHHLLKQAFAHEVMEKIPLATLRTQLHDSLTTQ